MDQNNEPRRVIFEGEEFSQRPMPSFRNQRPKIVEWVIKYSGRLVKDENQARYAILGLIGLSLVIAIILFSNVFSGPPKTPPGKSSTDFMNRP